MKTKAKKPHAEKTSAKPKAVRVRYLNHQARFVSLAGSFNDWRPYATPMIPLGEGWWLKELMLPPGRHEYRLVVDGEWMSDPAAPEQAPNPHGSHNSVLIVGGLS